MPCGCRGSATTTASGARAAARLQSPAPGEWDTVATKRQLDRIHPLGGDPDAYTASGRVAADALATVAPPDVYPIVVDFGCGDGRVLQHLSDVGYDLTIGVDASTAMLRLAAERCGATAKYVRSDGTDIDVRFGAAKLNQPHVIYSAATFIHMTYRGGARAFAGLATVLRPGGLLALQIPLYDVARDPIDWTDVGVWTVARLEAECAANGLVPVELYANDGPFDYAAVGPNHGRLQLLRKPS